MLVFKKHFKIVLKNLSLICMYISICVSIAVANTSFNSTEDSFVGSTPKVAIINHDSGALSKDLVRYLETQVEKVGIADEKRAIQDALYGMATDVVLTIPENFSEDLLSKKEPVVELKKAASSASEITELTINRYLKSANLYAKAGMSEVEIIQNLQNLTNNNTEVEVVTTAEKTEAEKLAIYFSFENYAFLSIFIFMIGTIMCVFNQPGIKNRNLVSATSERQINRELLLGNGVLTLSVWLLFVIIGIIIYKGAMFTFPALMMMLNSLVFAVVATCMAQLISSLIKNRQVLSGVQNAVALGLSFISGCFVAPAYLDAGILNFSKIFPSYWFIDNNYRIAELSGGITTEILFGMLVMVGFGVIYLLFPRIITKFKGKIRKSPKKNL